MEKEDVPLLNEWGNNPEYYGETEWGTQVSRTEDEKTYEKLPPDTKVFFIERKDGTKVGLINHRLTGTLLEIGYGLVPSERGKGYCSEAVSILVDYLFLSRDVVRIQAQTDVRNVASQKVLERNGFKREGTIRKAGFVRGEWRDRFLYSTLREEWKEPKMLTRTN